MAENPSDLTRGYRSPFAFPLSKSLELRDPNPVYSLSDRDLGVFVVANIAPENSSAALPAHSIAGTPTRADSSSNRRCAPCLPLARLTRRAPGQSLSARHIFHPLGQPRYPRCPVQRTRKNRVATDAPSAS